MAAKWEIPLIPKYHVKNYIASEKKITSLYAQKCARPSTKVDNAIKNILKNERGGATKIFPLASSIFVYVSLKKKNHQIKTDSFFYNNNSAIMKTILYSTFL